MRGGQLELFFLNKSAQNFLKFFRIKERGGVCSTILIVPQKNSKSKQFPNINKTLTIRVQVVNPYSKNAECKSYVNILISPLNCLLFGKFYVIIKVA